MIALDVLSECAVTAESLYLDPNIAWHLPPKAWPGVWFRVVYFSTCPIFGWLRCEGDPSAGALAASAMNLLYARHPSRPSGLTLHESDRAHPSHGSLPIIHSLPYHARYIDSPSARSPTAHLFSVRHSSPTSCALCYLCRTHPSSIILLGTPLPPPQWVSATSPRYASAHLYHCVPWWGLSRLSLDHTSRSRNVTRGRLSWRIQSFSRALLGLRTLLR